MISPSPSSSGGWWAIDVAGYLLSPLRHLTGVSPPDLVVEDLAAWIRATELPWAPGDVSLRDRPWAELQALSSDAELVTAVLQEVALEIKAARAAEPPDSFGLATRRRIPVTTVEHLAPGVRPAAPVRALVDAHVHQGAALPVEVTLHWVARSLTSIAEGARDHSRPMKDIEDVAFHPLPLLLLLRAVVEKHPEWERAVPLAEAAARADGADAWDELATVLEFEEADPTVPDVASIQQLKTRASNEWTPERLVTMLRIEGILHGAVTQRIPGLDLFVSLFEDFASIRRRRFPKKSYYERSIRTHVDHSPGLKALELRLGEMIHAGKRCTSEDLAAEYLAALQGYEAAAAACDEIVRVSFPLGLVKTRGPRPAPAHWRFDPGGGFEIIEALVDVLTAAPALAPYVDGLDVCGHELHAPNWLFAPMFDRFSSWAHERRLPATYRFHAGEWQWTPLHGLRRMAEFLAFPIPRGAPRRIGHGLALDSHDWSRIGDQPADELLDDLVWVVALLENASAPPELLRLLVRMIDDLVPIVCAPRSGLSAAVLHRAYLARTDPELLERIGFLSVTDGRLGFEDHVPVPGKTAVSQLVTEHLAKRAAPLPTAAEFAAQLPPCGATPGIEALRLALAEAYPIAAEQVSAELRWRSVVVEACPTSNVLTGGVRGYRQHPVRRMLADGVAVTFGSDDPSLFHSWIGDEVRVAHDLIGLSVEDVRRSQELADSLVAPAVQSSGQVTQLRAAMEELGAVAPSEEEAV